MNNVIKYSFTILFLLTSISLSFAVDNQSENLYNDSHLEHLQEFVKVNGEECLSVRIYAEAPDYHYVVDDDEGSACVDDVARAARLHMERYTLTGDKEVLEQAKALLIYVLNMQTENGHFHNFIWPDGSINITHKNSVASLNWWAARSFRSLCLAYSMWPEEDGEFRSRLLSAINKTVKAVQSDKNIALENTYDRFAVWLLAFNELKIATDSNEYDGIIIKLGQRILDGQHQPNDIFPYTLHFSWENVWHGWGALQVEAIASAGKTMGIQGWINAAAQEADSFHRWILKNGMISAIIIETETIKTEDFSQIAYGLNSLVQSNVALYEVTGDETYLHQAGLFASWFNGNNPTLSKMYDPASGRGYDGINNSETVNHNSGAESTIEALLSIHLVDKYSQIKDAYNSVVLKKDFKTTRYVSDKYFYELTTDGSQIKFGVKAKD